MNVNDRNKKDSEFNLSFTDAQKTESHLSKGVIYIQFIQNLYDK